MELRHHTPKVHFLKRKVRINVLNLIIIFFYRRGSIENLQKRVDRPNVKIECENGAVFYTDHVICTAPLGS